MSIKTRLVKLEQGLLLTGDMNYELIFCNDGESVRQAISRLAIDVNDGKHRIAIAFE